MSKLSRFSWVWLLVVVVGCTGIVGCWGGEDTGSATNGEGDAEVAADDGEASEEDVEAEVLLEPYDPPSLEELDAKVKWVDGLVLDALELLRQRQAGEQQLATVEEALALRNNSPEDNAKILSALGQLPASESDVNWDATFNRHISADVKSTNPLMQSLAIEGEVLGLTNFGLFTFDWNFTPFASAASVKSWQSSDDGLYDKIVMRDDLTWSDGVPITAHDIVFSFKTIMNPKVPVPAVRSGTSEIRWIEAYDDYTLVVFHKEPLATNVWNLNFPVIPKHIYEGSVDDDPTLQQSDYHVKYENAPISGGPYVVSNRAPKKEIVLTRREDYYMHDGNQVRDKPFFKEVRFRVIEEPSTALLALKNGEIEEMILNPELWQTQTGDDEFYRHNTKVTGLEWTSFHFVWNTKTPFFEDKKVRQAMSYAFDHTELLETLLYGMAQPCTGTFHPDAWMAYKGHIEPYKQNLRKAEDLLDEAGWVDYDGDGIRDKEIGGRRVKFEFTMLCAASSTVGKDICSLLKDDLDRIGIICNIKMAEFSVLTGDLREHKFQAAFGGWGTGADPDTSSNIWTIDAIKNGRNYGSYANPEIDKLFEAGKREFDRDKRAAIYGKIHKILWDDQPYTWLFFRNSFYAFNKSLRGFVFSPRGPYTYDPGFNSFYKPAAQ